MNPIQKMKAELKAQALEIRNQRNSVKKAMQVGSAWDLANPKWQHDWRSAEYKERWKQHNYGSDQWGVVVKAKEFRHKHIAASILRGTPYENVERKVREGNEPDWNLIQKYMDEYGLANKDMQAVSAEQVSA